MSFLQQALDNADDAANAPETSLKIGDHVTICQGDYREESGIIVKESENMFGNLLLIVKLDGREDDAYKPCCYSHELKLAD